MAGTFRWRGFIAVVGAVSGAVFVSLIVAVGGAGAASSESTHELEQTIDVRDRDKTAVRPPAATRSALAALQRRLSQTFLDVDRDTGTVDTLGRYEGALTGPLPGSARTAAQRWLNRNYTLIGLNRNDLKTLRIVKQNRAGARTSIIWRQSYRGIDAFDNNLEIHLLPGNRIHKITGGPVRNLKVASINPKVSASAALKRTARLTGEKVTSHITQTRLRNSRPTIFRGGHSAQLALFKRGQSVRLAWRVFYNHPDPQVTLKVVIDARTGARLFQSSIITRANAKVWDYYPGAPGTQERVVDLAPWLENPTDLLGRPRPYHRLAGPNVHVVSGADTDKISHPLDPFDRTTDIPAVNGTWGMNQVRYHSFKPYVLSPTCNPIGCSWNPYDPATRKVNTAQAGAQAFYFINRFHDYISQPPIGFRQPEGHKKPRAAVMWSANVPSPRSNSPRQLPKHVTDAYVTASAVWPVMAFSLAHFSEPPISDRALSMTDTADAVMYEYSHIMIHRLVLRDLRREPGLAGLRDYENPFSRNVQASALNESLADYFAFAYLLDHGYVKDTGQPGELQVGEYLSGKPNLLRTQPLDCAIDVYRGNCEYGGYSYKDFGKLGKVPGPTADKMVLGPEPHADGEILSQTLFELRRELIKEFGTNDGAYMTTLLITNALRSLGPYSSLSFLAFRDALLATNIERVDLERLVENTLSDTDRTILNRVDNKQVEQTIWRVFASRGMGADAKDRLPWGERCGDQGHLHGYSCPQAGFKEGGT